MPPMVKRIPIVILRPRDCGMVNSRPKIEIFRRAVGKTPLHPEDKRIVAIASDEGFPDAGIPTVDINDIAAVAEVILARAERLDQVIAALGTATSAGG